MAKKEIKVKGNDGRKELKIIIQDLSDLADEPKGTDVQAFDDSKTIVIDSGNQRLTITIAE